ncbi:hypothetical protein EYR41_005265 [Orbilia oligospora]|uniref:Mid2 domain-containing protein n=1 Tax=Orbilia oligospora TaxID=2813651 RepID=A0A8H2HJS2_ORBOL|nr:hypothetical protein EYR41_005265 [Orbilia oligospora]
MGHRTVVFRLVLLHFLLFFRLNNASSLILLSRDDIGSIHGWEGLTYQAIRYEPLCGSLGSADYYRQVYAFSPSCQPATEIFTNTTDNFAIYDFTGIRLRGPEARIGAGKEICVCFALKQITDQNFGAAICVYVNGDAQIYLDGSVALNYRPGVDIERALPICGGEFDVEAAREEWSRTAIQPQVTEVESTIGTLGTTVRGGITITQTVISTEYIVSTYIPPVVLYTDTTVYTATGPDGVLTTVTSARIAQMPVVTVSATAENNNKSDKVTLGVGLGLGIPALILVTAGVIVGISLLRQRSGIGRQASEEAGIAS